MLSQVSRASRSVAARAARANVVQMRGFVAPTVSRRGDHVQDLYLKELKVYKFPPTKDSDAQGQVQVFAMPKTPTSPEEANLAESLKAYKTMAVEIEGQDVSAQSSSAAAAELPDWLEAEEEDEHHAH